MSRRPGVLARLAVAALLGVVAPVLVAAPASAHTITGSGPTNYDTRIVSVSPQVPGLEVRVVEGDSRLELTNRSGADVIVVGYNNEPYLRVGPGGVFQNRHSPATYLNRAVTANVAVPAAADPKLAPDWQRVSGGNQVAWHDHRTHWMGGSDPPVVKAAPGRVHVIIPEWTVQLQKQGQTINVRGDLRWLPGPSPWPWVALAGGLAIAAILASRLPSWPLLLAAGLGLLIVVDAVHTASTWADLRSSIPDKAYGSTITAAGWAVGLLAIWKLVKGKLDSGLFYLMFSAGLIAVVGGLGDLATLGRSQLVGALPEALTRAAVAAKTGLGFGLVLAALVRMRQTGARGAQELPTARPDEAGAEQPSALSPEWPGTPPR
jgi:hypothetical protein